MGKLAGWNFYNRQVAGDSGGGGLVLYDEPIFDVKGRFVKGAGVYRHSDMYIAKTPEACTKTCSSAAHTAKCFAVSFKETNKGNKCEMVSEIGAAGVFKASGWRFYKKKLTK